MSGARALLRPIGHSVGRGLVLLAALAGLFAMHGLSDHGLGGPAVVTGDAPMVMAHGGEAMAAPTLTASAPHAPAEQPSHHGHGLEMAGLCLAVLVAGLLIGWSLRLVLRRPLSAWRPAARRLRPILAWLAPSRPPDLLALSIQRC